MPLLAPVAAMALIVMLSNIGVQFPVAGGWLTWGAFAYPFAFLVTDVANRIGGPDVARRVVLGGFAAGLLCSLVGTQVEGAWGPLVTPRIALGSAVAFLAAQATDIALFSALRHKRWWVAPLASTLLGSTLDTAVFFTIAFAGFLAFPAAWGDVAWAQEPTALGPHWVALAVADWTVKLAVALLALAPFRWITARYAQPVA